jgi:hypothetical protein
MAAATSTTASTSFARDFFGEDFVRDLVLIPVLTARQKFTRIPQPLPRPFPDLHNILWPAILF